MTAKHGVRTRIETQPTARAVLLALGGEIDSATAGAVEQAVDQALTAAADAGAALLVADLGDVDFCASAGFTTLLYAHRRARQQGVAFAVAVGADSPVRRLLGLTELDRVLAVHDSVEQALTTTSTG